MTEPTQRYLDERNATDDCITSERHRLLANDRRRALLAALDEQSVPRRLSELVSVVASRTGADATDVEIELHHIHLPMLAEAGVLAYDANSGRVTGYAPP